MAQVQIMVESVSFGGTCGAWKYLIRSVILHGEQSKEFCPTKVNLLRLGVIQDDRCDECNVEAESEGHLLWSCRQAQDVRVAEFEAPL